MIFSLFSSFCRLSNGKIMSGDVEGKTTPSDMYSSEKLLGIFDPIASAEDKSDISNTQYDFR